MNRFASIATLALLLSACTQEVVTIHPETGTEAAGLTCAAPDDSIEVGFQVVADEHELDGEPNTGAPQWLTIEASCQVASVDGLTLALTCADEEHEAAPVTVTLVAPESFVVPIAAGMEVELDYRFTSPGHHVSGGHWLSLRDAASGDLLVAAIENPGVSGVNDAVAAFDLQVDDTLCESPCGEHDYGCSDPHRLALRFDGAGESVHVLDGSRSTVELGDAAYDVIVDQAERYTCLNCSSRFVALIGVK